MRDNQPNLKQMPDPGIHGEAASSRPRLMRYSDADGKTTSDSDQARFLQISVMLPESQLKKRMLMLDVKVLRTFNINETGL